MSKKCQHRGTQCKIPRILTTQQTLFLISSTPVLVLNKENDMYNLIKILFKITNGLHMFFLRIAVKLGKKMKKIEKSKNIKRKKVNYENVIALFCFVVFVLVFTICEFKPKENIQTVRVERKMFYEYKFLKKCFPWLNEKVYVVIKRESERNNIDPKYLMSVIQYESGDYCANDWDRMQMVVSHAGAIGVCQIMPFHTRDPKKLYDYEYNISKGAWYLGQCMKASEGNIREAARKYNQGLYGKRWKYRNWAYVNKISRKYKRVLTKHVMVANNERN